MRQPDFLELRPDRAKPARLVERQHRHPGVERELRDSFAGQPRDHPFQEPPAEAAAAMIFVDPHLSQSRVAAGAGHDDQPAEDRPAVVEDEMPLAFLAAGVFGRERAAERPTQITLAPFEHAPVILTRTRDFHDGGGTGREFGRGHERKAVAGIGGEGWGDGAGAGADSLNATAPAINLRPRARKRPRIGWRTAA